MTQEEKNLLLRDLCARLPYKLHCRVFKLNGDIEENDDILYGIIGDNIVTLKSDKDECLMYYQIKPYLRPLSSMTEEEQKEFEETLQYTQFTLESYDWLNVHHFDFRNLIERRLAIEVIEENNPYKE